MKKIRIIKRTSVDGFEHWIIQKKHFFWWFDADSSNIYRFSNQYIPRTNWYKSLEEAKKNLCYFDGSRPKDEVVYEK